VCGQQPVAVTAIGFRPARTRPDRARDPEQIFGHLTACGSASDGGLPRVIANSGRPWGDGMSGAALFAGADLVGVLLPDVDTSGSARRAAVSVHGLAGDAEFVRLLGDAGELALTPISASPLGFPILQMP